MTTRTPGAAVTLPAVVALLGAVASLVALALWARTTSQPTWLLTIGTNALPAGLVASLVVLLARGARGRYAVAAGALVVAHLGCLAIVLGAPTLLSTPAVPVLGLALTFLAYTVVLLVRRR